MNALASTLLQGGSHAKSGARPKDSLEQAIKTAGRVIVGKERECRLALTCLLAGGHLLIEDVPGVGKTTLAHTLAKTLGLSFSRIQFTNDLLPADILGVSVYHKDTHTFEFQPGPIFAELVLADEINRASAKTQSALLEAMAERQVTQDGATRPLPSPFFVIATQNPTEQAGTFVLPESQLDRFMMRVKLGYPTADAERALLKGGDRHGLLDAIEPCMGTDRLLQLQREASETHVSDALVNYVYALVSYTRTQLPCATPLSPRAGLALLSAAKAWATLDGRAHVLPEDVQAVLTNVVAHRLAPIPGESSRTDIELTRELISAVPIA